VVVVQGLAELQAQLAGVQQALQLLGIDMSNPQQVMQELKSFALVRAGLDEERVQQAIEERAAARKAKDFDKADRLREEFASHGVAFHDSLGGTTWHPVTNTSE
jgi:cysteinyl-tRNA synthetase